MLCWVLEFQGLGPGRSCKVLEFDIKESVGPLSSVAEGGQHPQSSFCIKNSSA